MGTWLDEQLEKNKKISKEILPDVIALSEKYPEEKSLETAVNKLKSGNFNDEYLFELRSILRQIIVRKEYNFMSLNKEFWAVIEKIYKLNNINSYEKEDCFPPNFDFKKGDNYYYLMLPKLKKKIDPKSKSAKMTDQYIQNITSESLLKYKKGRENLKKFETYSLIFIHHYTENQKDKFDTDNIDIKKPIDSINGILIENDTVSRSHIFQITQLSDKEYTELFIVEGHDLGAGILKILNAQKSG